MFLREGCGNGVGSIECSAAQCLIVVLLYCIWWSVVYLFLATCAFKSAWICKPPGVFDDEVVLVSMVMVMVRERVLLMAEGGVFDSVVLQTCWPCCNGNRIFTCLGRNKQKQNKWKSQNNSNNKNNNNNKQK